MLNRYVSNFRGIREPYPMGLSLCGSFLLPAACIPSAKIESLGTIKTGHSGPVIHFFLTTQ